MNDFGLDTVRFVLPLKRAGRGRVRIPCPAHQQTTGKPTIGFIEVFGRNGYVEVSLPRRHFGTNTRPLPIARLYEALAALLVDISRVVEIDTYELDLRLLRLLRLDIARDFYGVEHLPGLLRSLHGLTQKGRAKPHLVSTTYLRVGVTEKWAKLYDKSSQMFEHDRVAEPPGHGRYELETRPRTMSDGWAKKNGGCIQVMGDITEEKCLSWARTRFEEVGFGSTVADRDTTIRAIFCDSGLSPKQASFVYSVLSADAAGIETGLPPSVVAASRQTIRDRGFCLLTETDETVSFRLDWQTGRQVPA